MSIRVRLLGWTHAVFGGIGVVVTDAVLAVLVAQWDPAYARTAGWIAPIALGAQLVWFAPSLAGGVGLLMRATWARPVLWMQTPLLLLFFPVGTVLAGFSLWALMPRPGRDPGADLAAQHLRWEEGARAAVLRYGGLVLAMFAALGLLGAMIGLGYLFRDQLEPKQQLDDGWRADIPAPPRLP